METATLPADFSDLDIEGEAERLAQVDAERGRVGFGRFTYVDRIEVATGPPSVPLPASRRGCSCPSPVIDGPDSDSCAKCGRTVRANGSKPAGQWTDDQLDQLRKLWKLRGSASWKIADLVLALVPVATDQRRNGANARVRKLSEAIGAEYRTLRAYRQTAHCWPLKHRVEQATFAAHVNWTAGGATEAADRAAVLRELAAEHGTVTVEHVKCHRANASPAGGARLLDRLRRLEGEFAAVDGFGDVGRDALRNGAARAQAIADQLERLAV